nr:phage integrase [uncultured Mediterranean phage uvMED]
MQVTPNKRKHNGNVRWVVDTRPAAIRKLHGGKGEQKTFRTEAEAQDYAAIINAAQSKGGVVTTAAAGTIDAAIALLHAKTDLRIDQGKITYKSGGNIKRNVSDWSDLELRGERFGDLKCNDATTADIEDVLIPQINRSAKTVKEKLDALKQLFDLAHKQGWCGHTNPARQVKLEEVRYAKGAVKKKLTRFSVEEIRQVICAAVEQDNWCEGMCLSFSAQTGLRFGETAALSWDDIDLEKNRVYVTKAVRQVSDTVFEIQEVPKTDAGYRTVFLTPQLVADLRVWKLKSPVSDLVFPTRANTFQRTSDNLRKRVLHPACEAAGIPTLRWHDLRHFFASICLELYGADFYRITMLMGHKSISTTTELYGHWVDDEERDEEDAAKFGAKLWG